jgi:predicted MFS family arabinose efflux permease
MQARDSQRNVRLYPLFAAASSALFWMPVFFLFFRSHLPLSRVLLLEAFYYLCVVLLEVPSGYFSDRVGRRATLLISSAGWLGANVAFFFGSSFAVFAVGQVLLAAGMAFRSGTDTAFHFESLAACGQEEAYGQREAMVGRLSLVAGAAAALVGGGVALFDLRWAYALSGLSTAVALVTVFRFVEPPVESEAGEPPANFLRQIRACAEQLRDRALAWLFLFSVFGVVINHIPYEFYQPYLQELGLLGGQGTPLVSGLHLALAMLLASWVAGRSIAIRDRLGLVPTLLLAIAIQTLVMAAMGQMLHAAVVLLILLRSWPRALARAPWRAAVTPRVPQRLRASFLSMISLAGRLSFALTLAAFGHYAEHLGPGGWQTTANILTASGLLGLFGLVAFALSSRSVRALDASN